MHAAEMQEEISSVKLFLFPICCSTAKVCFGQCTSATERLSWNGYVLFCSGILALYISVR